MAIADSYGLFFSGRTQLIVSTGLTLDWLSTEGVANFGEGGRWDL